MLNQKSFQCRILGFSARSRVRSCSCGCDKCFICSSLTRSLRTPAWMQEAYTACLLTSMNTHALPSCRQPALGSTPLQEASLTRRPERNTHTHTLSVDVREERLAAKHQAVVQHAHPEHGDARLFDQHGTGAQEQAKRQRARRRRGGDGV